MNSVLLAIAMALGGNGSPPDGNASWYDATYAPGGKTQTTWYTRAGFTHYAATGTFTWGDRPLFALVCRTDVPGRCVGVTIVDRCSRCRNDLRKPWGPRSRSIDLSPAAFALLGDLRKGVLPVTIRIVHRGAH